jgi:hypothetical protein
MDSSPSEPGRIPGRPQRLEFKADRPRQIDRYIDYFGDGTARSAAASLEDYAAATSLPLLASISLFGGT